MPAADGTRRDLPAHASKEHLRKQAKRRAKAQALGLAAAQRALAREYGASSWAELMRQVDDRRGDTPAAPRAPLALAARAADLATVRRLLTEGHAVDGEPGDGGTPLWQACASDAPAADRIAVADALLAAGANPCVDAGGVTPLHAAAARGPLALVELLIRREALEWQPDRNGRTPLQVARRGRAADRAAIIAVLDRSAIRDPAFRAAVAAIHRGDVAGLARQLDAEPRLLRERIMGPECYREAKRLQYFRDPKLFWFIANNPPQVKRMPANIGAVAETMIARGVDKPDLDYALELVMSSGEPALQATLIDILMAAGATPTPQAIDVTLAHWQLAPIQALLDAGHPMTSPIAAAMGRLDELGSLLRAASAADIQSAFGMAVINRQNEAARLALDAGADPNGFLPVHSHSLPLHQAAIDENLELMDLLVARGARTDILDKLWAATPLDWALHNGKARAVAHLQRLAPTPAALPEPTAG